MKIQRHFENENEAALRKTAHIKTMIADLNRTLLVLDCEISTEEEGVRVSDPADIAYSMLAQVMRKRRDNLRGTVALLEQRFDQIKGALPEAIATAA